MSKQNKRKLSDAVAQFFGSVTDAMGNFLQQASAAGASSSGPSSTQRHTRAKHARTSTSRANQKEDSDLNESSDSGEDSDYVAHSDHDDSDDWVSDGLETGDEEVMGSFSGDDTDGTGYGSDRAAFVSDGADEVTLEDAETDGELNKEESTDGAARAAMNPSAHIPQESDREKDKSGPTTEAEEIDKQDNVTLKTRLMMLKKAASDDKRRIDDKVPQPIPLEVIPSVKDATDDKASQPPALGVATGAVIKGSKEDRRAKLKLPHRSVQVDKAHVPIGSKKNKSDDDLTVSKSKGTGQHIQRSNSLDFTPPRCDIMRFIDNDDDDSNSQPDASVYSNQQNNGVHKEAEPDSAAHLYGEEDIDLETLEKIEGDAIRAFRMRGGKLYGEEGSSSKGVHTSIAEQQPLTSMAPPPLFPQNDANANIPEQRDGSANRSVTPSYQPPPKRHNKKPAALRSPYIDFTRKKVFKCSKEVCQLYDAVCASVRRLTRSSSKSPSKDIIIVNYNEVYVTLQELGDSVKLGGKLLNTVAEVALFALQPMYLYLHSKKRVFPLRIATHLMAGQTDRKEVNWVFTSDRNRLDHRQLVMFLVLQEIKNKDLEKVGHYFLLVMDLRNRRFEVLDSMRSLNDETLRACCNTLVSAIKGLWKIHYSKSKQDIDNYEIVDIGVPIQNNIHDCGFHMLMHVEHWDGSLMFNFTEKDMPNIRKLLTYKLFKHPENNTDWKKLLDLN